MEFETFERSSKRFKPDDYLNQRLKISENFKRIINQIDIDAETLLYYVNNTPMSDQSAQVDHEVIIRSINDTRSLLIKEVDETFKFNLQKHSNISQDDLEQDGQSSLATLISKNCVYLDIESLNQFIFQKQRLGILIKSDFHISENQIESLKQIINLAKNFEMDPKGMFTVNNELMHNFHLRHQIFLTIQNNQHILEISKSQFQETRHLKVYHTNSFQTPAYKTGHDSATMFSNLKVLCINRLNIEVIDKSIVRIDTLEELDLSENKIKLIQNGVFNNLRRLKKLDLSFNSISNIEMGSFDGLTDLEELNLSDNQLIEIHDGLFSSLNKLIKLGLSCNRISIIKVNTVVGLNSLKKLDLTHNECDFESGVFDKIPNLEVLTLNYLCKEISSKELRNITPKNLTELELTFDTIRSAPVAWLKKQMNLRKLTLELSCPFIGKSIFHNFNYLQELVISNTTINLTRLPSNLKNIKIIKFHEVRFSKKPEMLFKNVPPSLEEVSLILCEYPQFTQSRKMLRNIRNVKRVNYVNILNHMTTPMGYFYGDKYDGRLFISQHLWTFNRCLTELDLTGNKITTEQIRSFAGLDNLEKLILNSNEISRLKRRAFKPIRHIKYLDLSDNCIELIDKNTFKDFNNLEYLNISENHLEDLHEDTFLDLVGLKKLDMSSCYLDRMPNNLFRNQKNLEYLDCCYSRLMHPHKEMVLDLSNLVYANLDSVFKNGLGISVTQFKGLHSLKELILSCNNLETVDNLFDDLASLEKLDLRCNKIKRIDFVSLYKLEKLVFLDLASNLIEELDLSVLNWFSYREDSFCKVRLERNPICKCVKFNGELKCEFNKY